ncbi:hypothetical protein ACUYOF_19365 [Photobacterium ganghwense]|uniref:hypothetical protein n=1 Tax=Photobacterium ganghwense TaxID=320778 RepID=UPI004055FB99
MTKLKLDLKMTLRCILALFLFTWIYLNTLIEKDVDVPSEFKQTLNMLDNIINYTMPYFGGYSMKDIQVVLFNDSDIVIVWNSKASGKTEIYMKNDIQNEYFKSYYAKGEFNGYKTIFIQQDEPELTFRVLVHEGYHFYGQSYIDKIDARKSLPRGIMYPEDPKPRYLMAAAAERLTELLNGNNAEGGQEAVYFYNKLRHGYSHDIDGNLLTMLGEGTANFVEHLFLAVAKNSESRNNTSLIANYAYKMNLNNIYLNDFSKSNEYYWMSSLPMYYLAINNRMDLLDTIKNGTHPYDVLSLLFQEKKSNTLIDLKTSMGKYYEELNENYKSVIQSHINTMNDKDNALIKINTEIFPGSISYGDFINFENNNVYYTLNEQTNAVAISESVNISIDGINTITKENEEYFLIYLSKDKIKFNNGTLTVNINELSITNSRYEKTKEGEYTIGG